MKIWLDQSESIRLVDGARAVVNDLDISLNPGQLLILESKHQAKQIQSLDGQAWITVEGQSEDILLAPGELVKVERAGKIIANVLQPGKMRISIR
jgi:hypothetical protein